MGPKAGEGWKVLGGKLDMTNPLTRPFFARCPGFMEYMAFNGPAQQVLGGYYPLGTLERAGGSVVRERVSGGYLERYSLKFSCSIFSSSSPHFRYTGEGKTQDSNLKTLEKIR